MKTNENNKVSLPTEFGKLVQTERIHSGIKNAKIMADALGITPSLLSEIENGKKEHYPDIDFLIRCRDFFNWKIEPNDSKEKKREKITKTLKLFEKGLLSSKSISLDTKYFQNERKELLAKIITVLLFMPNKTLAYIILSDKEDNADRVSHDHINEITKHVSILYDKLIQISYDVLETNNLPSPPPRKKVTRKRQRKSTL